MVHLSYFDKSVEFWHRQMARDDLCNLGNLSCSTTLPKKWATSHVDEDMCQLDKDGFSPGEGKLSSVLMADDLNKVRFYFQVL